MSPQASSGADTGRAEGSDKNDRSDQNGGKSGTGENGDGSDNRASIPLPSTIYGLVRSRGVWVQVAIAALAVVTALLAMAPLEVQRRIVDDAIGGFDRDLLAVLALVYLGIILTQSASKYALNFCASLHGEHTIRRLREEVYKAEQRRGQRGQHESSQQISVIGREVERVGGFVGEAVSLPLVNAGMILALFGYMAITEPLLALIALGFFIPQIIFVPLLQRIINRALGRRVERLRRLNDQIADEDGTEGEETSSEDTLDDYRAFLEETSGIYKNRRRIYALKFLSKQLVNLFNHLAPLSVLAVGGWLAIDGQTTVGVIVAFITGFERMADPARRLVTFYRAMAQVGVHYDMVRGWLAD